MENDYKNDNDEELNLILQFIKNKILNEDYTFTELE